MRMRIAKKYLYVLGLAAVVVALSAVLVASISSGVASIRSRVDRQERCIRCAGNLMKIAMAIQNYHEVHQCYPPAYVVDRAGKPLYSWRVLIVPEVAGKELYSQFHLDEPWNSENNLRLTKLTPEVYRCPADVSAGEGCTSCVAVVGPHAAWRGAKALSRSDITDGHSSGLFN